MQSLAQTARGTSGRGEPLPDVWPTLASSKFTVHIRRSQVTMIAGEPGAGKTVMGVVLAVAANVPTLYFCADTDPDTMAARFGSAVTGDQTAAVEWALRNGAGERYVTALAELPLLRVSFQPSPSLNDIADEMAAYEEVYGEYPHLLVVDSLYDVDVDSEDEFAAMRSALKQFRVMARQANTAIVVLHHTNEDNNLPNKDEPLFLPPPRRKLTGKVSKTPDLILTVACDEDQQIFRVAVVKNRSGRSDKHARDPLAWFADLSRMVIADDRYRDGGRRW